MSVDKEDISKIAWLARLAIEDEDITEYAHSLSAILDLITEMNRVNTDSFSPIAHPFETYAKLREDAVSESIDYKTLQEQAPMVSDDGLYLVPKVIE